MKCTECEIDEMYLQENLPTNILLRWCKLLEYDFFKLYSQHLILYAPSFATRDTHISKLPYFRKNIYTQELIDFFLELIKTGQKTKRQVIEEYGIPHTTIYKWTTNESQDTINTRVTKNDHNHPNYKRSYSDIIDQKFPQKKIQCEKLLGKKTLSALDILELNKRIFNIDKQAYSMNQKLRSYGKSDIIYILDYQKKHGMNNL